MPCSREHCRSVFARQINPDKSANNIDTQCPNCACEQYSVSEFSPGRVEDHESLGHLIFWPKHIKSGDIDPKAFDNARTRGLSVNRDAHCSDELFASVVSDILAKMRNTANDPKQMSRWYGVVISQCHALREVLDDQSRKVFCVYDTGQKDNCSHADIYKTFPVASPAEMRKILKDKFSKLILAHEFRDGQVAKLLSPELISE